MSTILVVDDVAANRDLLITLLRYQGHRLLEAADGREGLATARAEHPDLVITDVLMPKMDGYELVRQLRLDPTTATIPVVFYTAHYGEREARALALSSGVAYVLTKPAEPQDVLQIVSTVLSGESDSLGTSSPSPLPEAFDHEHLRLVTDKLSQNVGDLKTANARLRALINIGLELASERDAGRLFQSVCASARDLFGATYITLGIVDRHNHTLQRLVSAGSEVVDALSTGDVVPGILGTVVAERRTIRGDNPGGDPAALQLPSSHPRVRAFLVAPIGSPAHVYGWILLVSNEGRIFTEEDEQLLTALAGQVGRIYENGYFYALARKERDRAQRYLDTAEVILLALDTEGRIAQVNRYACSVLGWTAGELLGRDWIDTCVPVRMRDALRKRFQNLIGGDVSVSENPILTRLGEERLIEWRNTMLRDETGNVMGTFSSGTDITERNQAETALRETEGRLAFALQRSHTGGWELDLRDRTARRTLEHDRIFGYESLLPEWNYSMFLEHVVPEDRAEVNRLFEEALTTQTDWAFECRIRRVDGEVRWIWATGGHQHDENGQVRTLAGIVQDITERKRAEEGLRVAEERMRFALQNAGVGIWDMDYSTGVLRWSETLEAHYGLKPGTFGGTFEAFIERVHPDDRKSVIETVGNAIQSGADFSVDNRAQWPDGTVPWLNGRGRVLLGDHGEPLRGVGISLDVSERHTLEEQYRQAQKMEAVGRLAGGVAHDFNNLLGVIMGSCELLLADLTPGDPSQADVVEIQKAGERAAGLTRQLLAFSRKQIVEPTVLDLNDVVGDMRVMIGRLIGEDVKVVVALEPRLALVNVDRGQIEQVIMNLSVNARDAMPRGGTLTIETANVDLDEHYAKMHVGVTAGAFVALTVSDTGTGITPEVRARLFEPFFTTKATGKGTGLGLPTVHGIVTGSGGSVAVYSEVGMGTAFKVYLPQAEGGEMVVDVRPPVSKPRGGLQTVLLVEDSEGLRDVTRKLLQRQGYTVLVAAHADEALRVFDEHPTIDVILTDVVMPGRSGPDLAKQLLERRPAVKVIFMSGYTEEAIVQHGVLKPGIAFLHKPLNSETLGEKICEVLGR